MSDKWSRQSSLNKNVTKRNIHECDLCPKRRESITSPITQSEGKESLLEPPLPSDAGDYPEWEGSTEEPKKYHFSGTVQDGNKGYFVEWYIDQKMGYDQLREVRALKPTQAERGKPPKERLVKKEIIEEAVKVKSQQDANYYPQPLQTPYITNAMNCQLQPLYYHSTLAHNYGKSSDKAPKRDD